MRPGCGESVDPRTVACCKDWALLPEDLRVMLDAEYEGTGKRSLVLIFEAYRYWEGATDG